MEIVIAPHTLKLLRDVANGILIGQRATVRMEEGEKQRCTVLCAVPCTDVSVFAEQVECIEQILPANLQVIGVTSSSDTAPDLLSLLKTHNRQNSMIHAQWRGGSIHATCASSEAGNSSGKRQNVIKVLEKDVHFCLVDCVVHSPFTALPLLVSTPAGESCCIDPESTHSLSFASALTHPGPFQGKQLGCSKRVSPLFPLVMCAQETSGQSVFAELSLFVAKLAASTHSGRDAIPALHRIPSARYEPLVYCHASDSDSSMASFLETIEDGMQECVDKATEMPPQPTTNASRQQSSSKRQHTPLLLVAAVLVLICAATVSYAYQR